MSKLGDVDLRPSSGNWRQADEGVQVEAVAQHRLQLVPVDEFDPKVIERSSPADVDRLAAALRRSSTT